VSLISDRASAFAEHVGIGTVNPSTLITEKSLRRLHSQPQFQASRLDDFYKQKLVILNCLLSRISDFVSILDKNPKL